MYLFERKILGAFMLALAMHLLVLLLWPMPKVSNAIMPSNTPLYFTLNKKNTPVAVAADAPQMRKQTPRPVAALMKKQATSTIALMAPTRQAADISMPNAVVDRPKLDLGTLHAQVAAQLREMDLKRPFPQLDLSAPTPEPETKLAKDLDRHFRPDCQTAYQQMGLLAVIPLVANTVSRSGCKW